MSARGDMIGIVKIRVDGHDFQVLSGTDLTDEELATYDRRTTAKLVDGSMSVQLLGDTEKAVLYNVQMETETVSGRSGPRMRYGLLRPPGTHSMNLAELRPMQIVGQPVPDSQVEFQTKLFHAVGAITVAGAHVELAMRKVYLSLAGDNRDLASPEVSAMWQVLERRLRDLCDDSTEARRELKSILDWSNAKSLSAFRNHAVHGYWWLFDQDGKFFQSRYYVARGRKPDRPVGISVDPAQCLRVASDLFQFANRLEALVSSDWPVAIMPVYEEVKSPDFELEPIGMANSAGYIRKPAAKPQPGGKPHQRGKSNRSKRRSR